MGKELAQARAPGSCAACGLTSWLFYTTGAPEELAELIPLRRGARALPARSTIYREGEPAPEFLTLFEGWAFRYKLIPNGRRQILSFLLPGDTISFELMRADRLRFSVQALTGVSLCVFERDALRQYVTARPGLMARLDRLTTHEIAAADDRLTELGTRSAQERVASLLVQLHRRLQLRGLADGNSFISPLRQQHIADALGLTAVHVSRVLRALKADGLIAIDDGRLVLRDIATLRKISGLVAQAPDERLQ